MTRLSGWAVATRRRLGDRVQVVVLGPGRGARRRGDAEWGRRPPPPPRPASAASKSSIGLQARRSREQRRHLGLAEQSAVEVAHTSKNTVSSAPGARCRNGSGLRPPGARPACGAAPRAPTRGSGPARWRPRRRSRARVMRRVREAAAQDAEHEVRRLRGGRAAPALLPASPSRSRSGRRRTSGTRPKPSNASSMGWGWRSSG